MNENKRNETVKYIVIGVIALLLALYFTVGLPLNVSLGSIQGSAEINNIGSVELKADLGNDQLEFILGIVFLLGFFYATIKTIKIMSENKKKK